MVIAVIAGVEEVEEVEVLEVVSFATHRCGIAYSNKELRAAALLVPLAIGFGFNLIIFFLLLSQRNLESFSAVVSDLFW